MGSSPFVFFLRKSPSVKTDSDACDETRRELTVNCPRIQSKLIDRNKAAFSITALFFIDIIRFDTITNKGQAIHVNVAV